MKKKVVMFGGGAKKRYYKYEDNCEYWYVNGQQCGRLSTWGPPADRVFNLHRFKLLKKYGYGFSTELEYAIDHPRVPFYTMDSWIPKKRFSPSITMPFPWEKMAKAMPRGRYHCGSFDWLVAYAVYCGFKHIDIHGVSLLLEAGEPISARACLEYWCGYAEGRGVKVTTAADCDLFYYAHLTKTLRTYGLDDAPVYEDRTKKGMAYDYKS